MTEKQCSDEVIEEAEIKIKYHGYIERERHIADKIVRLENISIRPDFDFNSLLSEGDWFHITGITPAISKNAADSALDAVKVAKDKNAIVSIDLNYRKKLWKYGKSAPEVMSELVKYADVVIANEEDIQKCLGIDAKSDVSCGKLDVEDYRTLAQSVKKAYPNVSVVAITLRESKGADHNGWSAVIDGKTGFYVSRHYEITDIVDRVGGGDSFASGLIYALSHYIIAVTGGGCFERTEISFIPF